MLKSSALATMVLAMCLTVACADIPDPAGPDTGNDGWEYLSGNLAPNPGFEEEGGWKIDGKVYTRSQERPRSGGYCLKYENDDPNVYALCSVAVPLRPGTLYEVEVWVRLERIGGKAKFLSNNIEGASVCLEWNAQDGRHLGGVYPGGIVTPSNTWQRVRFRMSPLPENHHEALPDEAASFALACYLRPNRTGVAYFDDVSVREVEPPAAAYVEQLLFGGWRGTTWGGETAVSLLLDPDRFDLARASLEVRAADGRLAQTLTGARQVDERVAIFEFDATPLDPGRYEASVALPPRDGSAPVVKACTFERVAEAPPVFTDRHGRLILDGKPFFPFGMYFTDMKRNELSIFADSGFNCVLPYWSSFADRDAAPWVKNDREHYLIAREDLDYAQAKGLKVIWLVKDIYSGIIAGVGTEEDVRAYMERVVKPVVDHPAIVAWYVADEPEAFHPEQVVGPVNRNARWMRELDPRGRPTYLVRVMGRFH